MSPLFKDARRATIVTIFALTGLITGTFFSRLAELQLAIGLTEGQLGVALIGLSTGVFAGSLLVSQAIERHGIRRTLLWGLPLFAAGPLLAALLADGAPSLFLLLVLFGVGLAVSNIAMNVEADRIEASHGHRLLNRCHALWGVGFLAASAAGTAMVAAGIPPLWHFVGLFILIAGATVAFVRPMQPVAPRAHRGNGARRRFARPTVAILLIMGFAISGMWLEGTMRNWSIIYLRDVFEPAEWVATLTLPSIVAFQIIGRLSADTLIDRYGPVRFARVLTAITFIGLLLVVTSDSIAVTLVGFALIGLGISTAHPQAMSAAARLGDRPSSENVAALSTLQTVLGLISPPMIGAVASAYGIHAAFVLLLPLPIIAIYFARYLQRSG
ncbi:MFS transporter [Bauldia sp.]|uniref:MFS transporter n=1 Tax=Bauldia sp. TaxID=2575872 RepID=UPI003BAC4FDD